MSHTWNDDSEELAWYRENCAGLNPAAYRACVEALRKALEWLEPSIPDDGCDGCISHVIGDTLIHESDCEFESIKQALLHAEAPHA